MSTNRIGYLNHPLNNSPSKTSYSFSKSERFANLQSKEDFQLRYEDRRYISPPKPSKKDQFHQSSRRSKQRQSKSPQKGRSGSKSPEKSPKKSASKSPGKRVRFQSSNEYYAKTKSPERIRNELSKQNKQRIKSKQFYPLGIQINNEGKYVISTYQNVKTCSFGKPPRQKSSDKSTLGPGAYDTIHNSPGKYVTSQNKNNLAYSFSKSPRKGPEDPYSDPNFGPGMYRTFSQFGQSK